MYEALRREACDSGPEGLVLQVHHTAGTTGASGASDYRPTQWNASTPTEFESDNFKGRLVVLHRPVSSYTNAESGEYPYKQHFHGRKRLWEWRIQGRFKRQPGVLYAGIELEEYVHHNLAARTLTRAILPLIQRTLECKDVLHELGSPDEPDKRPAVVAPVWVADNTLVSKERDDIPDICAPTMPTGLSRKAARQYWDALWAGRGDVWNPHTTYTWCVWGPSPLLDLRNLVFRKLPLMTWGRELPFATFCGNQPIHAVMYELSAGAPEKGHRQASKVYAMDMQMTPEALWEQRMFGTVARPTALSAEHLQALDYPAPTPGVGMCRSESFCSAISHTSDPASDIGDSTAKDADAKQPEFAENVEMPRVANILPQANGSDREPRRQEPSHLSSPVSAAVRERLLPPAGELQERAQAGWLFCCRRRRRRTAPLHQWLEVV